MDLPPIDPRLAWELPPLGTLPFVERVDELVTRVIAPNASHMTLDGTNTYVLGQPGSGSVAVVDPGPDDPEHRRAVEKVMAEADAACDMVIVTHHHPDHAEAARSWAAAFGCVVASATRGVSGSDGVVLGGSSHISVGGMQLDVVPTPGHCGDHIAFRLPSGTLLTGDHVLGRGASVVAWPDGDLEAYLGSLRRVRNLGPDATYPGHGPALTRDPGAVLDYYTEHRAFRERQILGELTAGSLCHGPMPPAVDRRLWDGAGRSTRAALEKLLREGVVVAATDRFNLRDQ